VPIPTPPTLPARNRSPGVPVPPQRMAPWRARRPLKHWRYVGLFGEGLSLCAGSVRVAGLPQAFWAVWDGSALRERTVLRSGPVDVADGVLRAGPADLRWEPDGEAMEVTSPHGSRAGAYIWTRKQPVRATGTVDGRAVELRGLLDDSAGYHARRTDWRWCAGVGEGDDGAALAFNVVTGLHDAATESERTLWVDGTARELPPATLAGDLSAVRWASGEALAFTEQARRARRENFGLLASDYVQPFGALVGTLPGDIAMARGWGVMERHSARW
jgi:hypothetical protein